MSEERPSEILGSLPHTRPHRRSDKRRAVAGTAPSDGQSASTVAPKRSASAKRRRPARPQTLRQPKQPGGTPPRPRKPAQRPAGRGPAAKPPSSRRGDVLSTAVRAAAELTEIGLSVSSRAVRGALGRLPKP